MATVIAYLRVSTDKQTLENQRSEIRRFENNHKIKVDKWVEEITSGKVKDCDRKLGLALKRLKKGDTLIVCELSRLSRTLLDIMSIMRTLLERGVTLYSVKENFCLADNISSKVILFAFGLAAEIERDLISLRTKEALACRKEQGIVLGHKAGVCPKMELLKYNKDDILRQLDEGSTIGRLCEEYRVSRGTMSKFLKESALR
ncbi:MAG: recombinase family protein [Bacteroidales bacterium]|nr:recombinase family protein [Bacteroidales bacterium]